jgi:hypothetical protein
VGGKAWESEHTGLTIKKPEKRLKSA